MYQAFSMIVSFIALAIVSSSTLFITGNNKNIDFIKNKTSKLNDDINYQNELTKKQILSLIDNVNDNDTKIMSQHKNITNTMKKVEKESKLRTENVDSRLKSFKTITNSHVVGITDQVATNNRNVNKRVNNLTKTVNDNKKELDDTIKEVKSDYDDLNTRHGELRNAYYNNITTVNDELTSNVAYTNQKHSDVMGFVNETFSKYADTSIAMTDAAELVMNDIKDLTTRRMQDLENNYKAADGRLNKKIDDKDSTYKSQFLYTSALKDQVNAKFFANQTSILNFNDMINKTISNSNDITFIRTNISDNDNKIENIKKDYVKTSDLSNKINNAMSTTDIYKEVQNNKSQLTNIDDKVKKNIETIDDSNKELKNMLNGITGGLNGEISLKDLNERIVKNAENIKTSTAQNNREMMREVRKETGGLDAKIKSNTENISKKLDNNKNEYVKAFKEYISDEDLVTKIKNKPIEVPSIKLNEANIDKELIVNGTKFSTVVKNLENVVGSISKEKKSGQPRVARYDRDFSSGTTKISPNRTIKFRNEDTKLEMKDSALNLDDTNFSMENGTMNIMNSTLNWSTYGNNKVNMSGDGVHFNSTNVKFKDFSQLKANEQSLPQFIDSQIQKNQDSSSSGVGGQVSSFLEKNDLTNSKSIMTPRLYIGNSIRNMDVKDEIENLKKTTTNSLATSQVRQEARYFNKQNPKELHEAIRKDFIDNSTKYLPNNILVGSVQAKKVLGVNEMTLNDGGANGLNKIKLNGSGLKTVLDGMYESKGTTESALTKAGKSISSIEVIGNRIRIIYTDNSPDKYIDLPESGDDPIVDFEIDEARNRIKIRRKSNRATSYKLPQVDLSPYATKSEYAPNYKKDQGNVVYLNNTRKSRLDAILGNDKIKNLGTTTIPDSGEVSSVKTDLGVLNTKMTSAESDITTLKAQHRDSMRNVNLNKINEYTRANSAKSDNYIALNEKVSLKASGNRLQMCQDFSDGEPSDCHDLWTTKDITEIDTRKIQYT